MLVPLEVAGSAPYMSSDKVTDKGISSSEFRTFEEILWLEPPAKLSSEREELETVTIALGHPPREMMLELKREVVSERELHRIVHSSHNVI